MVPQKEVQPPQETALGSDMTTADMVKVGREIMEGKGICLTCHTIGKTGALRFPDLAGIGAAAKSRVPGLSDVEYLAQSLYEPTAFVVPGFPPAMPAGQPASDRPHRSGDPLRDRGPPDAWRHADGHAADDAPLLRRRGRTGRGAGPRRRAPAPGGCSGRAAAERSDVAAHGATRGDAR